AHAHWVARRPDEAELGYKEVLALDPLDAAAMEGLALIATFRGDEKEARRLLEKAFKTDPSKGTVQVNLISIYLEAREYQAAKAMAIRVLAKSPAHGLAHYLLGEAHRGLGEFKQAAEQYDLAATAHGDMAGYVETAVQVRLAACDWRAYDMEMEWIRNRLRHGYSLWQGALPFLVSDSPSEIARVIQIHSKWLYPPQPPLFSRNIPRHDRIRIGYVTGEMYDHPVGNLIGGVLENHDRDKFEIFAFSYGPRNPDKIRSRLIPAFEHFVEVGQLDAESTVRRSVTAKSTSP
ncbi:MAG: tetratricopeptide repeat protein, partial [Alphaproteobacteria bacterium]